MKLDAMFESAEVYALRYRRALASMLSKAGLTQPGDFIAVCATANGCKQTRHSLWPDICETFELMVKAQPGLINGEDSLSNHDRHVFSQLYQIGLENIDPTITERVGPFEAQLNPIRALRPKGVAADAKKSICEPFDHNRFHFRVPNVRSLTFWEGELAGKSTALIFNMFPFVENHTSLMPEIDEFHPQLMTKEIHFWIWEVMQTLGEKICGIGCGYNSVGGCASVNHFHFHLFIEPFGLPVQDRVWKHNGGTVSYPALVDKFTSAEESWAWLENAIELNQAHNLLYSPNEVFCFRRRMQGATELPKWTGGFGWCELSGRIVTIDQESFNLVNHLEIEQELCLVTY